MSRQTCSIYCFVMGDNTRKTHNIMLAIQQSGDNP
jgi:hypothetical protein